MQHVRRVSVCAAAGIAKLAPVVTVTLALALCGLSRAHQFSSLYLPSAVFRLPSTGCLLRHSDKSTRFVCEERQGKKEC